MNSIQKKPEATQTDKRAYWHANLRLTGILLVIWFSVSFGAGILFRDFLDQFAIGGAPLGFWFAQQGSIITFVILIFYYCFAMNRLEHRFMESGRKEQTQNTP